ncbi:hypothetical protein PV11_06460 [Exophiala sideris]|uniref:Uncharacterized protein n=1 Tax=Exophiala sideris TaxID=1016849 RepID=A0A0D1WUJ0_9EURO|nr:hypothetical protein PV11_06460 [Exophiala sideris]
MKLVRFATSAIAALLSKRDYPVDTVPAECYGITNTIYKLAEAVGYNYTALCTPDSEFMNGYASVQVCIAAYTNTTNTTDSFPDLQSFVNYCLQGPQSTSSATQTTQPVSQTSQDPLSLASVSSVEASASSVLASYASSVSSVSMSSSSAWCSSYSVSYQAVATNCTSSPTVTTAPYVTTVSVTSLPTSTTTSLPGGVNPPRDDHTGAIAGGVVGGVIGLAAVVLAGFLFRKQRHKRLAHKKDTSDVTEKAQLHSDDVKPDRKELQGTDGPQELSEKKPTEMAEMAANEEVARDNLKELPSNEPPGHEMETTENEMAVLDRLARLTDSTTLVSSRSRTDDTPDA